MKQIVLKHLDMQPHSHSSVVSFRFISNTTGSYIWHFILRILTTQRLNTLHYIVHVSRHMVVCHAAQENGHVK